jgi:hypothetical protein
MNIRFRAPARFGDDADAGPSGPVYGNRTEGSS